MRRLCRRSRQDALRPGLLPAPMIDCVFLLLVFFAARTLDRPSEGVLKAFLPRNRFGPGVVGSCSLGSDVRVKLLWYDPISLRPTDDPVRGRAILKVGTKVYDAGGHIDYEALLDDLIEFRDAHDGPSLPVIIDARGPVPFHHVVSVLNVCAKARITDVSFAAPEKPH